MTEKIKMRNFKDFKSGFDTDTQVLTKNYGWKNYNELNTDDEVCTWAEDGYLKFEKPAYLVTRKWNDDMIVLKNRHADFLILPETRIPAKIRKYTSAPFPVEFETFQARDLKKTWQITLAVAGILKDGEYILPSLAYAAGLWMSGVISDQCTLDHLDDDAKEVLADLMDDKKERLSDFYKRENIQKYLKQTYPNKTFDWSVLKWDIKSKKELIRGLMDGNGTVRDDWTVKMFWCRRDLRTEIFHTLTSTMGYRSKISFENGVYFNEEKNTTQIAYKDKVPPKKHKGMVWNLKIGDGRFLMIKRNQKICMMGGI